MKILITVEGGVVSSVLHDGTDEKVEIYLEDLDEPEGERLCEYPAKFMFPSQLKEEIEKAKNS